MNWISIKDRLPKLDTQVLIFTSYNWYDLAIYTGEDGCYCFDCDTRGYHKLDVTHWTPLPKPPNTTTLKYMDTKSNHNSDFSL